MSATITTTDVAYFERNLLVAALTKLWPSHIWLNPDDEEWPIIYIESPMGQLSWHVPKRELILFEHLEFGENTWDGHSPAEKEDRLNALENQHARIR
jgi:hypothetical protein